MAQEKVQQLHLAGCQLHRLPAVCKHASAVEHDATCLRMPLAPSGKPALDPPKLVMQRTGFGRLAGSVDHRAKDGGELLVDDDPAGDLLGRRREILSGQKALVLAAEDGRHHFDVTLTQDGVFVRRDTNTFRSARPLLMSNRARELLLVHPGTATYAELSRPGHQLSFRVSVVVDPAEALAATFERRRPFVPRPWI